MRARSRFFGDRILVVFFRFDFVFLRGFGRLSLFDSFDRFDRFCGPDGRTDERTDWILISVDARLYDFERFWYVLDAVLSRSGPVGLYTYLS